MANNIENKILSAETNLRLLSNHQLIEQFVLSQGDSKYTLLLPNVLKVFKNIQKTLTSYYEIQITDLQGLDEASLSVDDKFTEQYIQQKSYFQQIKKSKNDLNTFFYFDEKRQINSILISQRLKFRDPIYDNYKSLPRPRAYIMIKSSIELLEQQINSQKIGNTGYTVLLNRHKEVISQVTQKNNIDYSQVLSSETLKGNAKTSIIKAELNKSPVFIHLHALPADLLLLAVLPEKDIREGSHQLTEYVFIITIMTILILVIFILVGLNLLVLRPIYQLSQATNSIENDAKQTIININGNDEITHLAKAFIQMRERVLDKFKTNEKMFQDIIDHASAVIYLKDTKGRYLLINRHYEDTFSVKNNEINGKTDFDLFPLTIAIKVRENDKLVISGNKAIEFEETVPQTDGTHTYISIKFPLKDANGEIYSICGISTDITERKKAQEELEHHRNNLEEMVIERTKELTIARSKAEAANIAKSNFLATMSHEIRTPLNGVIGLAQLLSQHELNSQDKEIVDKLISSSDLLHQIIDNVLDIAKIESNKMYLEQIDFDFYQVINNCLSSFNFKAQEKGITLVKDIDPLIPERVCGDPYRLSQIILNLIGNALKFTTKGTISIKIKLMKIEHKDIWLGFSVADTGVGISKEQQKVIFNLFTQADDSTTRKYGGSGLGLNICQQLIKLMSGTISVNSEQIEGSTFYFSIKLNTSEKTVLEESSLPSDDIVLHDIHVLIVDDEEINRYVATSLLESMNIQVTSVDSGEKALVVAQKQDFDLVLMDIHMPDLDGWETTKLFRSSGSEQLSSVPIIGLTADALKESFDKCINSGMNLVALKPFKIEELKKKIYKLIKSRTQVR